VVEVVPPTEPYAVYSLFGILRVAASKPEENVNMFWNSRSCMSSGNPTTKIVEISSGSPLLTFCDSTFKFICPTLPMGLALLADTPAAPPFDCKWGP
jgi:hypothetical protein